MTTALTIPRIETSSNADLLERWFVIGVVVLCGGAFVNLFLSPETLLDSGSGIPAFRYAWTAIYGVALALLTEKCPGAIRTLLREYPVVFLVLLAVVSCVWSTSPGVTFRRSASVVGFTLVATYFAIRFPIREQLKLLVWSCGLCVTFSYVFELFGWGRSVDNLPGAWFGIYTQRNGLGSQMSLSTLIFLLWGTIDRKAKYMSWFLALAAFGLVVLSGSITSLVVTAVVLVSFPVIRRLRRIRSDRWLFVVAVALLCVCAWRIASSFETIAEAMGRDSSLTGRVEVWAASAAVGSERPWFGYGYNGFWLGIEGPSAEVWRIAGWAVPSAHNGVLETWLDLGALGVAIAVFGFAIYLRRAHRLVRNVAEWDFAWPLMFLILLAFQNLTESAFFGGSSIHWFLYVVTALNLSRFQRWAGQSACEADPCKMTEMRAALPKGRA